MAFLPIAMCFFVIVKKNRILDIEDSQVEKAGLADKGLH